MAPEVDRYDGPNEVVVNRNPRNMGAINHMNALMERASGEYIVFGNSDDRFLPERVSRIAAHWRETGLPMISSNVYLMDEDGNGARRLHDPAERHDLSLDHFTRTGLNAAAWGAAMAWHRDVYDRFGPIDPAKSPFNADHIIPFRGLLLGGNGFIGDPLLYYRMNPQGDSWRTVTDATQDTFDESRATHFLTQNLYCLETLFAFAQSRPDDATLADAQRNLLELIARGAADVSVLRNRLIQQGLRSVWRSVAPATPA